MVRQSSITLESECSVAEQQALTDQLKNANYTGAHLEIGTAAGGTLKQLMGVYPDAATRPEFYVVDPLTYFPDQLEKVRTNLKNSDIDPDSVTFWVGKTPDHLSKAMGAGHMFDFVFIDGDHRAYHVTVDLQWADLVNVGGTICLHDRQPKFPGVGWAIDRFLDKNPNFKFVSQTDSLVILEKTADAPGTAVSSSDLAVAWWIQKKLKYARSIRKRLGR